MKLQRHEKQWLNACRNLAPIFSTCSRRQYFAVVLADNKRVLGVGYNGAPPGMTHCEDGGCPRANSSVAHGSPYDAGIGLCIAQHAEAGALLWSDAAARRGGTLIVNGPPCMECAKLIASGGITRVVHYDDPEYPDRTKVADFLLSAGITVVTADPDDKSSSIWRVKLERNRAVGRYAGWK